MHTYPCKPTCVHTLHQFMGPEHFIKATYVSDGKEIRKESRMNRKLAGVARAPAPQLPKDNEHKDKKKLGRALTDSLLLEKNNRNGKKVVPALNALVGSRKRRLQNDDDDDEDIEIIEELIKEVMDVLADMTDGLFDFVEDTVGGAVIDVPPSAAAPAPHSLPVRATNAPHGAQHATHASHCVPRSTHRTHDARQAPRCARQAPDCARQAPHCARQAPPRRDSRAHQPAESRAKRPCRQTEPSQGWR